MAESSCLGHQSQKTEMYGNINMELKGRMLPSRIYHPITGCQNYFAYTLNENRKEN